jgi:uncharacterized protein
MTTLRHAALEFLDHERFAVIGVARKGDSVANAIYKKLRASGRTVFPVNPNASELEGDTAYPSVRSIPGGVEAAIIATHPSVATAIVRECAEAGIDRVWIHGTFGGTDVPQEAITTAGELGVKLIPGGCPMMFCEPVDLPHRCMRWFRHATGREPHPVR